MAATARQEREMKMKYNNLKDDRNLTPVERLRAYVLSKGVHGLKHLSILSPYHNGGKYSTGEMAATARQEREMKMKYDGMKDSSNLTPLERLRAHVLAKGVTGLKHLNITFKRIDEDKNGSVDFREFKAALKYEGLSVPPDVERACFDEIDTDHSGLLSFDEFLVALRPPMPKCRTNLIMQAFRKLDRDGSGELTIDDLRGVYNGKKHPKYLNGQWTEDQVLEEWLSSFKGPGKTFTGEISYEDFENYYAGVSASIDSDAYFDLMMRQAWKL